MNIHAIQEALLKKGYDVGSAGADGILGRDSIAAINKFKIDNHLPNKFPGSIGPQTLRALGFSDADMTVPGAAPLEIVGVAPWLDLLISKKGLREREDNAELRKFLASDGHTLGDPAKNPWCGDLMETCLALTLPNEKLPGNPYLAANWATWGQFIKPTRGAIMSFWRGSPTSGLGHVAAYDSESEHAYNVWGGNQHDTISKTSIAKDRLRKNGSRWPNTWPVPVSGAIVGASGKLSTNEA